MFDKSMNQGVGKENLDCKLLVFRNGNRPRLRYLYFKMVSSFIRRRRYECTGWRNDLFNYVKGTMWGSPGKWLRGSALRTMARKIGHEIDLEKFFGTSNLLPEDNQDDGSRSDDELVADEIFGVVQKDAEFRTRQAPITAKTDTSDSAETGTTDDDDDDDETHESEDGLGVDEVIGGMREDGWTARITANAGYVDDEDLDEGSDDDYD